MFLVQTHSGILYEITLQQGYDNKLEKCLRDTTQ